MSIQKLTSRFNSRLGNFNNLINSGIYWEKRYFDVGNSGAGSFGEVAKFKSEELRSFIKENGILNVIDLGCGDLNQISSYEIDELIENYIGYDISTSAIELCRRKIHSDKYRFTNDCAEIESLSFNPNETLVISFDVVYHLVENHVYKEYIALLLKTKANFIMVFSSNYNDLQWNKHVRHRKFTNELILKDVPFKITKLSINGFTNLSSADMYFFKRVENND